MQRPAPCCLGQHALFVLLRLVALDVGQRVARLRSLRLCARSSGARAAGFIIVVRRAILHAGQDQTVPLDSSHGHLPVHRLCGCA